MGERWSTMFLVVVGVAGCAEVGPDPEIQQIAWQSEVLEADLAFAALSRGRGAAYAFQTYAHPEDVTMLPAGSAPAFGPDAVAAGFQGFDGTLDWAPEAVSVSSAGDLAYTWGYYTLTATDAEGQQVQRHGKYTSIWRRDAAGEWRFVLDIGNPGPEPDARVTPP